MQVMMVQTGLHENLILVYYQNNLSYKLRLWVEKVRTQDTNVVIYLTIIIQYALNQLPEWEVTRRTPNNALLHEAYPSTARPHRRPITSYGSLTKIGRASCREP